MLPCHGHHARTRASNTVSLQERRRVEEQYVLSLRRLAQSNKGPYALSELGYVVITLHSRARIRA